MTDHSGVMRNGHSGVMRNDHSGATKDGREVLLLLLIDDHLYSALFSALSSRLTALPCDSTWVTSSL